MFKKLIVFISLLFSFLQLQAEVVPYDKACRMAADFFGVSADVKSPDDHVVLLWKGEGFVTKADPSNPPFYVFGSSSGQGFVIISGEDALRPVLAWSHEGHFRHEDMPGSMAAWFDDVDSAVAAARETGASPFALDRGYGDVVLEMKTAAWDQNDPYNYYCPVYNGEKTLTGCVATSMAIVMRYREWPTSGSGTVPAYETSKGIKVEGRKLGRYDWENMPLTDAGSSWTQEQERDVAILMADCGAAIQANYGLAATSASEYQAFRSMIQYMSYDASAYMAERSWYSDKDWNDLLKSELSANGPVMYSADNKEGGHAFVIDGYTSEDYFHVNWGWGGTSNGYYTMSLMNPSAQNSPYDDDHNMVINLKPDEGGKVPQSIKFYSTEFGGDILRGIHVKETDPDSGLPVLLNLGGFWNKGDEDYMGKFRLGVFDREGNLIKKVWEYELEEPMMPSHYRWFLDVRPDLGEIDFGYRLLAQFYDTDTDEWELIRANRDYDGVDCVLLADEYSIEESTVFRYSKSLGFIFLFVKDGVEVTCKGEDGKSVDIHSAGSGEYQIDTNVLEGGRYTLCLNKGKEKVELVFVTGGNGNE